MAIVISRDVLFLHVPKAGGSSVTAYLLDVLPPPVYYMSPGPLGRLNREGTIHRHGLPHQPLIAVRDLARELGFALEDFRAIIAVVRNPYDIVVSNYAYQRRVTMPYELIDEREAPRPAPQRDDRYPAVEALVAALTPGKVARIEPAGRKKSSALRWDLWRAAARLHRPIDVWNQDGVLYAALANGQEQEADRRQERERIQDLAEALDFREFVLEEHRSSPRPWLRRLYDFYHLEGAVPRNLRIVRFERLADDVRGVLRAIGLTSDADFPWLNRSERGAYATYYDAETEAVIYGQARWLFDQGFYPRLDLVGSPQSGML